MVCRKEELFLSLVEKHLPRCVSGHQNALKFPFPYGDHVPVLQLFHIEKAFRLKTSGRIAAVEDIDLFLCKAFGNEIGIGNFPDFSHHQPFQNGIIHTAHVHFAGLVLHKGRRQTGMVCVKMGQKQVCLFPVRVQFCQPFQKGIQTFFPIESSIYNQCFAAVLNDIAVQVFQGIVRQRHIHPINGGVFIYLCQHSCVPFSFSNCIYYKTIRQWHTRRKSDGFSMVFLICFEQNADFLVETITLGASS